MRTSDVTIPKMGSMVLREPPGRYLIIFMDDLEDKDILRYSAIRKMMRILIGLQQFFTMVVMLFNICNQSDFTRKQCPTGTSGCILNSSGLEPDDEL